MKRKQQREAVDALLSSALISSKKSESSVKSSAKRTLSTSNTSCDPIRPQKRVNGSGTAGGSRSIKFLKKTLSFSESSSSNSNSTSSSSSAGLLGAVGVPKGYVAVCVGKEVKRFVIPTEYLRHQAFGILLREAEEEFGFQQEGVLKFPCEVDLFEKILKMMEDEKRGARPGGSSSSSILISTLHDELMSGSSCPNSCSPDTTTELTSTSHHPQMCR
ncbi:UNVERIFIED_CONTAM: Auxin-responsive protein SAUR71 [Sesamum radiatum]|uniref:Auxin-responsive protein SAUR71 n=1 Tax=Sesamum radiatum TaxID=300843 RepID=A0AAW2PGK4_SESRA